MFVSAMGPEYKYKFWVRVVHLLEELMPNARLTVNQNGYRTFVYKFCMRNVLAEIMLKATPRFYVSFTPAQQCQDGLGNRFRRRSWAKVDLCRMLNRRLPLDISRQYFHDKSSC